MLVNASLECRCVNRALLDRSTAVKVQGRPECTSERLTSSKCSSTVYLKVSCCLPCANLRCPSRLARCSMGMDLKLWLWFLASLALTLALANMRLGVVEGKMPVHHCMGRNSVMINRRDVK